jgi:hypothetical protein
MAKSFYETIIASGGFAGESFDVAAGPANTAVIDVLLSVGDGILTEDAPVSLVVSGALGAARELDLTNCEQDGRFFFLSARASDISTNNLTIMVTTDINGMGPTSGLTISESQDYLLVHESGGMWRAYQQKLTQGADSQVFRGTFSGANWAAGTANQITIVQTGAAGAGEIGPHSLGVAGSYTVNVVRDSDDEMVDVGVIIDDVTGNVTLTKTGLGADFAGRIMIVGTAT